MNHLKLIQEKVFLNFEDNLQFIIQTTGYDEIISVIPDIMTDACDEFNEVSWAYDSGLYLKYKRAKRNQEVSFNLEYFLNPKIKKTETDKKYPADFLAKAEFAQSMWLNFDITFRTGDLDSTKIVTTLTNIIETLNSYGWPAKLKLSQDGEEVKNIESFITGELRNVERWKNGYAAYKHPYYISLRIDIDIEPFKAGNEYLTKVPKNVIADFTQFCDRLKLNSGDRELLADLIQRSTD